MTLYEYESIFNLFYEIMIKIKIYYYDNYYLFIKFHNNNNNNVYQNNNDFPFVIV
jgi:hypothetical protein